jgi:AraC family transcriptional regulator of adaptative response/methylated-DNA-[protein]-cysteine methyltransferase
MHPLGDPPAWANELLGAVDRDPFTRIRDADLRARTLDPGSVRRWFQQQHGMTFQAYQRHRRLGTALAQLHRGERVTETAFDTGYESLSGFRDAVAALLGDTPTAARGKVVLRARQLTTPLGPMLAVASDEALHLLEFTDRRMLATQLLRLRRLMDSVITPGRSPVLTQVERELADYFAGRRREFDVPLALAGTEFQESVWRQLLTIPYGETRSYDDLARRVARPGAQRAVGRANGDNRLAIVVPCHRVVRADGTLSGYGGGVWRKQRLLDLEAAAR